ncbi:MAG: CoA transferase [Dehalococcoidia bacterium]
MTMPLKGYRVLDMTTWFQSVAPRMMGDLGAEVIKIEPRGGGDPMRGVMDMAKLMKGVDLRNMPIEHANYNKKSICLDLTKEKGRDILYKLVEKSDVFIHNLRSKAAIKLGIDYPTMKKHNPRLIYALSCAWGSKGDGAERASYDRMAAARSGLMSLSGALGTQPGQINGSLADHMGATMMTLSIVTALLNREKTGEGMEVESSLLGSVMHLIGLNVDTMLAEGVEIPRLDRTQAPNPMWNEYFCKDGKGISLGMLQADRYWHSFCQALGIEKLEKDPRFENFKVRAANGSELIRVLDGAFASKTRAEWTEIMDRQGDLIFEPINSMADLVKDPQIYANKYVVEYENPQWGKTKMAPTPIRFGEQTAKVYAPPPEYGQHTEMILNGVLGIRWEQIVQLKAEEVI